MPKAWIVCLLAGLVIVGSAILMPARAKAVEESVSGRGFQAIQAAMAEFNDQGLDISRYRIIVHERATSLFVSFIDADVTDEQRLHVRGNPGTIPGFEVELRRDNLGVVRSHFIK